MKRALLIAGGTVGGLGAVLSVTPPQLGSDAVATLAGASAATSGNLQSATTQAPASASTSANSNSAAVTTKKATTAKKSAATTSKSTKSSTSSNTNTNTNTNSNSDTTNSNTSSNSAATESASPTPTKAATAGVSGSFTGDAYNVSYGMVQVRITVSNGKITDAVALQSPMGRSQRFSDYAIPNLRSQTLAAQSAAIRGVSGASYTSYGWYKSLISALQKAGMNTGV